MRCLRRLLRDEDAVTAAEYAVVLGLIFLAVVGAVGTLGSNANTMWTRIFNTLKTLVFGG